MRFNLPLIGEVNTGKDTERVVTEKEKSVDLLGGFLQYGTNSLSGEKSISNKILQANRGWVYRNNDAIAQEVSKIDFELYTVGLSGGEVVYNEVTSNPLLDLLDKPNDETTKSDLLYVIQSHKKLAGDAFLVKIRNANQVVGLRVLPPDKVTLILRTPTEEDPTVIEAYNYRDTIDGNRIEINYDPKDIIHFKKPNPSNPFRGLGAVEALADTIDLDNLTTETTKKFFENGAITNFVLTTPGKVTDDQLKRLNAEMRASYVGARNAYKAMVLGGGLEPKDISYSNKELEFLAQLEWYRDKIMYGFGNTKASLGMVEDVNRASFEGSNLGWLRTTIRPDMQAIVNTLNEFLVPEFGMNMVLGFTDPVPEDTAEEIDAVKTLYPIGVITQNEAREMVNFDEVDGGDEFRQEPTNPFLNDNGGSDEKPQAN